VFNVQSDLELVKDTLAGREQAFELLVQRYERLVRATAMHILKDRHLAGDVAQEAFVRAYQRLPTLREPAAFGAWLTRIAHRCALDLAEKKRNELPLDEGLAEAIEGRDGRLEEDQQVLLAAVMQLPAGEKEVVMLRYFKGHTVQNVASIAGRSVGTVTKQLSRAHRHLKTLLEEP
jgi:RNA polymerase sigma-70 factor (ECF subfamily)